MVSFEKLIDRSHIKWQYHVFVHPMLEKIHAVPIMPRNPKVWASAPTVAVLVFPINSVTIVGFILGV